MTEARSSLVSVVLCLFYEKNRMGAACYNEEQTTIHFLEDVADDDEFNTLAYRKFLFNCSLLCFSGGTAEAQPCDCERKLRQEFSPCSAEDA